MDVGAFEDLIDRLGEDLSRWPDAQRLAALELLAASAQARELHEQAQLLRRVLAGPQVRAPAGLADRIVTAAGKLKAQPSAADAEPAAESDRGVSGKVLPVLLLALSLLPLARPTTAECGAAAAATICATL